MPVLQLPVGLCPGGARAAPADCLWHRLRGDAKDRPWHRPLWPGQHPSFSREGAVLEPGLEPGETAGWWGWVPAQGQGLPPGGIGREQCVCWGLWPCPGSCPTKPPVSRGQGVLWALHTWEHLVRGQRPQGSAGRRLAPHRASMNLFIGVVFGIYKESKTSVQSGVRAEEAQWGQLGAPAAGLGTGTHAAKDQGDGGRTRHHFNVEDSSKNLNISLCIYLKML